jgi:hypothetical protein
VTGHVAEELVAPRTKLHTDDLDRAGRLTFGLSDRDRLELVLVDRQPVAAQR